MSKTTQPIIGSMWIINSGYSASLFSESKDYNAPATSLPSGTSFVVVGPQAHERILVFAAGRRGWIHVNWLIEGVPGVTKIPAGD